jgi:hypothetical protein
LAQDAQVFRYGGAAESLSANPFNDHTCGQVFTTKEIKDLSAGVVSDGLIGRIGNHNM